jgi:replication-associated recombination protein RarA
MAGATCPCLLDIKGENMKTATKYAPQNLNEVIYPNASVEHRIHAYATGQLEGHVMLHGPNGTGKSTVAKLLVNAVGGQHVMLESKDLSELLAMPKLKDYMFSSCQLAKLTTSKKHFMILEEFDEVKRGVDKFWTALDACGDDVMAIITTNHPMNINQSVRSRFDLINFAGLSAAAALPRIQHVLGLEGLVMPNSQALCYLQQVEHMMDLRKYFKKADELLYLHANQLPFPVCKPTAPVLKVI